MNSSPFLWRTGHRFWRESARPEADSAVPEPHPGATGGQLLGRLTGSQGPVEARAKARTTVASQSDQTLWAGVCQIRACRHARNYRNVRTLEFSAVRFRDMPSKAGFAHSIMPDQIDKLCIDTIRTLSMDAVEKAK